MWTLGTPPLELVARAAIIYFVGAVAMRWVEDTFLPLFPA
jgi:hypothetical protein